MFLPSFEIHPSYFAKCSFHPLKFIPHTLPNVPSIFFCFFKFQSVCPATLFPTIRHFVAQSCPNSYSSYIGGPNEKKRFQFCPKSGQSLKPSIPRVSKAFRYPSQLMNRDPPHSGTGMAFDPVKFDGVEVQV
jgi:hypothetical protein